MIHQVFTVLDTKAEAYHQPFISPSIATAIRAIADTADDPSTMFHKHPEDYGLFHLGNYDDTTAMFELFPVPTSLGLIQDIIGD